MVQLSHPYMTTGGTIALTRRTFAGKVMSLLFNMLFRFVIAFLPRGKHFLISWLQSLSTVIFGAQENKPVTVSIFPPSFCHEVMGSDAMILVFGSSRTVAKVLSPTTDFPTWGSGKGTENPQGI